MNDFILCKDKEYYIIFKRYRFLFNEIWDLLTDKVKFYIWPYRINFNLFCYDIVKLVVDSINLDVIKEPKTWTLYNRLYNYITTYAQREIERENSYILKKYLDD